MTQNRPDQRTAVILGAGPAGLTAAYELLRRTEIQPIVFEMTSDIGGLAKTVSFKGNRIDIGGHRFYSKSDRVMEWWQRFLPLQGAPSKDDLILGRKIPLSQQHAPDPEKEDKVLLVRNRISRIYCFKKFFDYPVTLSRGTLKNLGIIRTIRICLSYLLARVFPIQDEKNLEDFFINRFGRELYITFFKDYTEKVWGIPCQQISKEWGSQRIKGLSVSKVILNGIRNLFAKDSTIRQKNRETSLIEKFVYPKFGPGQMWEEVARSVKEKGGEVFLNSKIIGMTCEQNKIVQVKVKNEETGEIHFQRGDYFFSSMPLNDLIFALDGEVPDHILGIAEGLKYRDFITIGLLLKKLRIKNETTIKTVNQIIPDHWIYIQEKKVRLGRLQIYNNWSPYLVHDFNNIWTGLEYFCEEGDELWRKSDKELSNAAIHELASIGLVDERDVLDSIVLKLPKAYPSYSGTHAQLCAIRTFLDRFENLFLIGRNGLHRYNNMDHSMLTAMTAVENIINGTLSKDNIWSVNTEAQYLEK